MGRGPGRRPGGGALLGCYIDVSYVVRRGRAEKDWPPGGALWTGDVQLTGLGRGAREAVICTCAWPSGAGPGGHFIKKVN